MHMLRQEIIHNTSNNTDGATTPQCSLIVSATTPSTIPHNGGEEKNMGNVKILVGRTSGKIEAHVIRVRARQSVINAIVAYGTALQSVCGDIDGISHERGYTWTGHKGQGEVLAAYTRMGRPKIAGWDN